MNNLKVGTIDANAPVTNFMCQTTNGAEYTESLAVQIDFEKFAEVRLNGGVHAKTGKPSKLTWYQHYSEGNSVAKEFGLTFIQLKCLRESQSYLDAIMALDNVSDADKAKLTRFSSAHGTERGPQGKRNYTAKVEKVFEDLAEVITEASAKCQPAELNSIADAIAKGNASATASIADRIEEYRERQEKLASLENDVVETRNAFDSIMKAANAKAETMKERHIAMTDAKAALDAFHAEIAEADAEASVEVEVEAEVEVEVEVEVEADASVVESSAGSNE